MKRLLAITFAVLFVALALLVVTISIEGQRDVTLPAPRGAFAVGKTIEVWQDAPVPEADPAHPRRELLASIWYPAKAPAPGAVRSAYVPAPWAAAMRERAPLVYRAFLNRDPTRVHVHSVTDAEVSDAQASWPVVV